MDASGGDHAVSGGRRVVSGLAAAGPCLCICFCVCVCGCSGGYSWADHSALVLRPSHRQVAVAISFGADPPAREVPALAGRNVAAAIAAAMVVRDDEPLVQSAGVPDNMDFKGGRLFIRAAKPK